MGNRHVIIYMTPFTAVFQYRPPPLFDISPVPRAAVIWGGGGGGVGVGGGGRLYKTLWPEYNSTSNIYMDTALVIGKLYMRSFPCTCLDNLRIGTPDNL